MTAAVKKLQTPQGYRALTTDAVGDYLSPLKSVAQRLGGAAKDWQVSEVGDGNLNLVFIVKGPAGSAVVKQALPYVRLVGESWPLPLARAHYEYLALTEQVKCAPQYVPAIYHHDDPMALTVMECLSPHIILRKGLVRGIRYPQMAKHLGEFLGKSLFATSDLAMSANVKKEKIAQFLTNTALCNISEDLIFDEPYFAAPMNRHTTPQLDDIAAAFRADAPLKNEVQAMKWRFMNAPEAMIHGDLHTGSVMVTDTDTRAIDPEFAFFGPMGFDVGAVIGNFLLAYFSQPGHAQKPGERDAYAAWVLEQIPVIWDTFAATLTAQCRARAGHNPGGAVLAPRVTADAPTLADEGVKTRLAAIWQDTLGFAGCKMIRRILGLAHVEDMEAIVDQNLRGVCERKALLFARRLLTERGQFKTAADIIKAAAAAS